MRTGSVLLLTRSAARRLDSAAPSLGGMASWTSSPSAKRSAAVTSAGGELRTEVDAEVGAVGRDRRGSSAGPWARKSDAPMLTTSGFAAATFFVLLSL